MLRPTRAPKWQLRSVLTLSLAAGTGLLAGCGSLSPFHRSAAEEMAAIDADPRYSIQGTRGPTERALNGTLWKRNREELAKNGDAETKAALARFDAAQEKYDAGKFAEAEKEFSQLAKDRRAKYESGMAKFKRNMGWSKKEEYDPYSSFGDPIEEDAIFMTAQSQFSQKKYPDAQNSYDDLLTRYPSSRHLDQVTRSLFKIARYWLDFEEDVGPSGDAELKLANNDQLAATEQPKKKPSATTRVPVLPNLTDSTRPLFDTYGRGEQALRSIWLHDSTGKLADDALMLAASHNLRTEDFVEARRLYSMLRENYPDSPHLKDAFYLGSAVSLASYQGAAYDGRTLDEAMELKATMLQVFADLTPEQRKQVEREMELLKDAKVARLWEVVEFYKAKRQDPAIALHCNLIINRYPDSQYAERARQTLAELDEKYRNRQDSNWPWSRKRGAVAAAPQPQQKPATPSQPQTPPAAPQGEPQRLPNGGTTEPGMVPLPEKGQKEGGWWNPLRKLETKPDLKRIEPDEEDIQIPTTNDQTFPGRASLEN
ncbi:outer membrane protein assembly factor BamD [Planctomicrobium sp. SH664]|uniref:outer membrane protein assembly factor BamD n=1 Tax=Planctomicrobium sp. SH664 TaxID=3448125 RepID=UPI003F5B3B93